MAKNSKMFRVRILGDRWPVDYNNIEAVKPHQAIDKAFKQFYKQFKGSRATEWSVKVFKVSAPSSKEE